MPTDKHEPEPTQAIPAKDGDLEVPIPSRDAFMETLRKVSRPRRQVTDVEREFLDRYLTDDRVVGVRFGESMIEVQVVRHRGKVDLPEVFDGRPVVVRDFPAMPDSAAGDPALAGDGSPGPLADLF